MRSGVRQAVMTALAALVASWFFGSDVQAQVLVVAEQDLDFGSLTPGVAVLVTPTDVARRAAFTIEGRGQFDVRFQLPAALVSPEGAAIPLTFGAASGRAEVRQKVQSFDPAAGVDLRINPAETFASVYLGALARPAPGQPAGSYEATITVTIVQTGN